MSERRADCKACGKVVFLTRKAARLAARKVRKPDGSRGALHAYRCPERPEVFHLGHLPIRVRLGDMSAREFYNRDPIDDREATL